MVLPLFPMLFASLLLGLGAAIQAAVGAGLSVVCGAVFLIVFGAEPAIPLLLALNLLVSLLATSVGIKGVEWRDVATVGVAALIGTALGAAVPTLPDLPLRLLTADVLMLVALRRPAPVRPGDTPGPRWPLALGGVISGLLTVWTATPGPVVPMALAHAGRDGDRIRRAMQPISVVGYGVALVLLRRHADTAALRPEFVHLAPFAVVGTFIGVRARPHLSPPRVVHIVRAIAIAAALLLVGSVLTHLF